MCVKFQGINFKVKGFHDPLYLQHVKFRSIKASGSEELRHPIRLYSWVPFPFLYHESSNALT